MPEDWKIHEVHWLIDKDDENLFRQFAFANRYGDSAYTFRRLLEKAGLREKDE